MNLMVCMHGESEDAAFLPEIAQLGAGIELGSYGVMGVRSEEDWRARLALHKSVRAQFNGPIAVHGPFIGIDFAHIDHLLKDAVQRRMDMTFDAARQINATRIILHSGHKPEVELFKVRDVWMRESLQFWQHEILRWASAGIEVALENDFQDTPELLFQLADLINNPFLGLCFDVGHQHAFSTLSAPEWVEAMGPRLRHAHLHDNDRTGDYHWPPGRGTINFDALYDSLTQHAPNATLSLEIQDTMEAKMAHLSTLAARFAKEGNN